MEERITTAHRSATAIVHSPEYQGKLRSFVTGQMVKNVDYGAVPGTEGKPTLFKSGAEKLCRFFGLAPDIKPVKEIEDFFRDEPLFYYRYRCELYWQRELIATCEGSCNSWEKKYRYREEKRSCPRCGNQTIRSGEREFYCWKKIGGCGARFPLTFEQIVSQKVGFVPNPEIFDQVNTIQKMAQKRALIGAVLIATGASEFFNQEGF
ncbi:MAG: hypothetical protein F6K24_39485 [Okeania sp. SIO2D1]|nr:hypothetical protein [Okeania sp. SIO2D1]